MQENAQSQTSEININSSEEFLTAVDKLINGDQPAIGHVLVINCPRYNCLLGRMERLIQANLPFKEMKIVANGYYSEQQQGELIAEISRNIHANDNLLKIDYYKFNQAHNGKPEKSSPMYNQEIDAILQFNASIQGRRPRF